MLYENETELNTNEEATLSVAIFVELSENLRLNLQR